MRLDAGTQLPPIPGVNGESSDRRNTEISVLDFGSEYLPLPYAPRTVSVAGDWAYDPNSLIMLSSERGDRDDAIRNLSYSVESVDVDPNAEALSRAVAGTPADGSITAEQPADLPEDLKELTRKVTKGEDTDAAKAWAIQEFLRGTDFTYSTEPLPGSGYRALENFLLRDRRGYCEQFAASMAMMAREVGIPSRVAVGFLPGDRVEGNTWEVSIRDMHAWPELFFAGYGWVRFEPTPASVTGYGARLDRASIGRTERRRVGAQCTAVVRGVDRVPGADRRDLGGPHGHRRRQRVGLAPDPDRNRHRSARAARPRGSGDHPVPPSVRATRR